MIDEELVWQRREVTGETIRVCENCGRPIGASYLQLADDETTADGGVGMRVCPDCLDAMTRGTAPVELDDDEDPESAL